MDDVSLLTLTLGKEILQGNILYKCLIRTWLASSESDLKRQHFFPHFGQTEYVNEK